MRAVCRIPSKNYNILLPFGQTAAMSGAVIRWPPLKFDQTPNRHRARTVHHLVSRSLLRGKTNRRNNFDSGLVTRYVFLMNILRKKMFSSS